MVEAAVVNGQDENLGKIHKLVIVVMRNRVSCSLALLRGLTDVYLFPPKVATNWRLKPMLVLWGFIARCQKGLLPAVPFFLLNINPRLPGQPFWHG